MRLDLAITVNLSETDYFVQRINEKIAHVVIIEQPTAKWKAGHILLYLEHCFWW